MQSGGAWHLTSLLNHPKQQPLWALKLLKLGPEGLPTLRVCYLSLVSGPRPTGSPALSSAPSSRETLFSRRPLRAAESSHAKHDRARLASASSRENGFQISIAVGFQQHPHSLPQAQQPSLPRTTGAKTKVGPGDASPLPEPVTGPWGPPVAPECQVHAQEVEGEAAASQHFLEGSTDPLARRAPPS